MSLEKFPITFTWVPKRVSEIKKILIKPDVMFDFVKGIA
jgi:hypothetical protein